MSEFYYDYVKPKDQEKYKFMLHDYRQIYCLHKNGISFENMTKDVEKRLPRRTITQRRTHSPGEKKSITLMKAELQTKNDDRFCGSETKNVQLQIITMKIIKAKAQKKYVIKQKT